MKFLRRTLSILLAAVLMLTVLPLTAFAAGTMTNFKTVNSYRNGQFTDLPSWQWYANDVRSAYELGLMMGTGGNKFSPSDTVTLAQAVTMAARLHSIYYTGSENFQQSGSTWYSPYVDYAKSVGILTRDCANYSATATRAQFASIFARALPASALAEINSVADGAIPDVPVSHTNAWEIYLLYRAGVLTGTDDALTFCPSSSIGRAEAAAIVTRMALPDRRVTLATYTWDGDPSLDFTVQLMDGNSFTLSEQAGKVVLVNFWATWCGPCVREMPDIAQIYEEYSAGGEVEIVAVNAGESVSTVRSFLNQQGYTFPVACDTSNSISWAYGVTAIPRTVIFSKDGKVTADFTGAQSRQTFKTAIDNALKG